VRYADGDAMRMALEQRLRNEAAATGVALMRLRKRVAFERFLARLSVSPAGWVLKGAFALELRLGLRTRMTKDIDLARDDEEAAVTRDLAAAAALDLGDFFSFRVHRTPALERAVDFRAVRYSVLGELAGRLFEQFPLDVGLVEAPALAPELIELEGTLGFADIDLPPLAVIAIEQHIAEKVHAYTASYGDDEQRSTRVKDLVDLVLIARHASPRAQRLRLALRSTFEQRARQPLPTQLPPPPKDWATPYARQAHELDLPSDLHVAHAEAAGLLEPTLASDAEGVWDAAARRWRAPPGP
jgi:predicted nucleotidyltransferase component of viral defense system